MNHHLSETWSFLKGLSEKRNLHITALLTISFIIVFYNLGQNSFHNGDEAIYSLAVKEILRTGNWLTLHVEGERYFMVPPFMIWLSTLSSKAFGFSEFSVRLPSAIFGVLTIIFTYLLAERLSDRKTALLSSLMVLTCSHFIYVHSSKTGEFDSALTFLVLLTVYFIWNCGQKKSCFYYAFACIGIVAMIKTIVFVIPAGILFLYLLLSGRMRDFSAMEYTAGLAIFLLIALPWHIIQVIIHGRPFIDIYLLGHIIGRRVGPGLSFAFNPVYYINVILRGFFPWSLVIPFAVIYNLFYITKTESRDKTILLFTWAFVVLLICNIVIVKYNWYIMPIYPALAIINGIFLVNYLKGFSNNRLFTLSLFGMIIPLVIMAPEMNYNPFIASAYKSLMKITFNDTLLSLNQKSAVVTILILILTWLFLSTATSLILKKSVKRFPAVSKIIAGTLIIFFVIFSFVLIILPLRFSNHKSEFDTMSRKIWAVSDPGTVLVLYGNNLPLFKDYIYFHNFKYPHRSTARHIGLDDNLLFQEVTSSLNRPVLMERQHYNDIRSKDRFKALLPQPVMEHGNYILLGKSDRDRLVENIREHIPIALNALKNNDPGIRRSGAQTLGKSGHVASVSSLITLLDDPDDRVVSAAAKALSDLRYKKAAGSLKTTLKRYREDEETYQAISLALAYLRDESSVDFLVKKYKEDPLFLSGQASTANPPEFSGHNRYWTAYLLIDAAPLVARDVILENLIDHVRALKNRGTILSGFSIGSHLIYRLGNKTALDLIKMILESSEVFKRKIALHLLSKPPMTKMPLKAMERARYLLGRTAEQDSSPEIRALAGKILQKYNLNAWVSM